MRNADIQNMPGPRCIYADIEQHFARAEEAVEAVIVAGPRTVVAHRGGAAAAGLRPRSVRPGHD